ncbi:MAG: sigma-70 family RNA polymerase sigma factor, partial [Polyangiaceae bacterium]
EFDRRYDGEIPAALSRLRSNRTTIDEVSQIVREKLFVAAPGGRGKIAEYAGRGALLSWLRAVAVRTALSHRRREGLEPQPHDDIEPLLAVAGTTEDPELEHIRARYAEPFKTAFHEALRALTPQDRNILRLHVVDGLNIDQIGAVYGVHRSTVARWIAQSRESLVEKTRALLSQRLRLDTQEFESLTRFCRSRLDLSMGRVLGE